MQPKAAKKDADPADRAILGRFSSHLEIGIVDDGRSSPTIGEALWHLEYVLQLHEAYKRSVDCESFGSSELGFADMSFSLPHIREGEEEHNSKPSSLREDTDIS